MDASLQAPIGLDGPVSKPMTELQY